ncbi:hypothetical protein [Homoserinibacter gongjuensis]|uniref:hypothetical protein n=1 Tax=Homoserinibacter gongjuensis TaxID=1162968 RepID=UPI0024E0B655|nr:hypothetical protein [Homoserinibacter gongjuensis]
MSRRAATAHGATLTRTPHRIPNPEADLFSLTRMRQHAGVFGSLLVVAAIVSGLALGVLALIDRAAAAGVRGELATHTGEDAALRLSLLLTTEETAADAAVRGLLADAFQRDGAPIPVSVQHEVRTTLGVPVERLDTTGLEERMRRRASSRRPSPISHPRRRSSRAPGATARTRPRCRPTPRPLWDSRSATASSWPDASSRSWASGASPTASRRAGSAMRSPSAAPTTHACRRSGCSSSTTPSGRVSPRNAATSGRSCRAPTSRPPTSRPSWWPGRASRPASRGSESVGASRRAATSPSRRANSTGTCARSTRSVRRRCCSSR